MATAIHKYSYVLIVGDPGAGKTNVLLDLALSLLSKAQINEGFPITVVVNLASWRGDEGDFSRWLEDVLVHGNGFSRSLAKRLIRERQVIPLLDGFDEIGRLISDESERELLRNSCLMAINKFLSTHEPEKLVICSRVDEYTETTADAPVKAEILVEPLQIEDVKEILRSALNRSQEGAKHPFGNITAAQNMLYWIDSNPVFANLMRVPFYFNLASQALCFQNPNDKGPSEDVTASRFLIERFIATKFGESQNAKFRYPEKNIYWLRCLASILTYKNDVAFELSTLQPSLLSSPRRFRFYYSFLFTFAIAFYSYSSLMLSFALFGPSEESSMLGTLGLTLFFLFSSVITSLGWGLFAGILGWFGLWGRAKEFSTEDIRRWKLSKVFLRRTWIRVAKFGWESVGTGFKFGLLLSVPGAMLAAIRFQNLDHLFLGLAGGGLIGAFGGFAFGVIGGTLTELSRVVDFRETQSAFQKLKGGLFFYPFKWLLVLVFLTSLLTFGMFTEWSLQMKFGVICWAGVLGAIIGFLLTPFFKHFLLRYCLKRENVMPWRIEAFLDYATELRILVRYAGKWRFRHQILHEFFATLKSNDVRPPAT